MKHGQFPNCELYISSETPHLILYIPLHTICLEYPNISQVIIFSAWIYRDADLYVNCFFMNANWIQQINLLKVLLNAICTTKLI